MTSAEQQRVFGRVKFFHDAKGFGFVLGDDGKEYFVHHTNINAKGRRTLLDDQRVSFLPAKTDKGIAAHFVTVEPS